MVLGSFTSAVWGLASGLVMVEAADSRSTACSVGFSHSGMRMTASSIGFRVCEFVATLPERLPRRIFKSTFAELRQQKSGKQVCCQNPLFQMLTGSSGKVWD